MTYNQYGSSLLKYLKWFIIYRNMAMRKKKLGENLYVYITLISTIVKNIVVLAISKESNTVLLLRWRCCTRQTCMYRKIQIWHIIYNCLRVYKHLCNNVFLTCQCDVFTWKKKYLQDYNFPTGKKSFPIGHLEEFEFR